MECLLQYLDDLEDLVYALALLAERIRRAAKTVLIFAMAIAVQVLGIALALSRPPMAIAAVSLMTVAMLYRSVTGPIRPAESTIST
jgi:cation transport ATPase